MHRLKTSFSVEHRIIEIVFEIGSLKETKSRINTTKPFEEEIHSWINILFEIIRKCDV